MFLDKFQNATFRSKYSFNIVAIFSLIVLFILPYAYFSCCKGSACVGFAIILNLSLLLGIFYIASFVALIIYIFEEIHNIRIKSEKFLNSKFIFWFQILGFASFLILILLHLYFVIMLFI